MTARYRAAWSPVVLEAAGPNGAVLVSYRRGDLLPVDVPAAKIAHLLSVRMIEPVESEPAEA